MATPKREQPQKVSQTQAEAGKSWAKRPRKQIKLFGRTPDREQMRKILAYSATQWDARLCPPRTEGTFQCGPYLNYVEDDDENPNQVYVLRYGGGHEVYLATAVMCQGAGSCSHDILVFKDGALVQILDQGLRIEEIRYDTLHIWVDVATYKDGDAHCCWSGRETKVYPNVY